jgi:hypothetical protein
MADEDGHDETTVIRMGGRDDGATDRLSPRMRFDILQLTAVVAGAGLLVGGLVVLARAGFDDLSLYEPVVTVAGQPASPLYGGLWALLGVLLLASGTGDVAERRLRMLGIALAIIGAVLLAEPDGFAPYLGVDDGSGTPLVAAGLLLAVASFLPPLSVRRPGVSEE